MTDQTSLDALLVLNIGDIDAAIKRADKILVPRMWTELGEAIKRSIPSDTWHSSYKADKNEVWLSKRNWLTAEGDAKFWLGIDEATVPGGDGDHWLGTFTGSGPNGATLALWIDQSFVSGARWKALLRTNTNLVEQLREKGFQFDETNHRRLYLPILIDRLVLAKAFDEDDFDAALQPMVEAAAIVVAASVELDQLYVVAKAEG